MLYFPSLARRERLRLHSCVAAPLPGNFARHSSFAAAALLLVLTFSNAAVAGPITAAHFSDSAVITTFSDVGLEQTVAAPLDLGAFTVSTSSGFIRILDYFPGDAPPSERCFGGSGTCVGTGLEDLESLWVDFATPVHEAGLWVGLTSDPFAARVSFLDASGSLLGSIDLSGAGGYQFAGWEADSGPISRILVEDTSLNNRITLIDNVTVASVPEPSVGLLVLLGCVAAGIANKSKKHPKPSPPPA